MGESIVLWDGGAQQGFLANLRHRPAHSKVPRFVLRSHPSPPSPLGPEWLKLLKKPLKNTPSLPECQQRIIWPCYLVTELAWWSLQEAKNKQEEEVWKVQELFSHLAAVGDHSCAYQFTRVPGAPAIQPWTVFSCLCCTFLLWGVEEEEKKKKQ